MCEHTVCCITNNPRLRVGACTMYLKSDEFRAVTGGSGGDEDVKYHSVLRNWEDVLQRMSDSCGGYWAEKYVTVKKEEF